MGGRERGRRKGDPRSSSPASSSSAASRSSGSSGADGSGGPDADEDGLLERWVAHHEEQQDTDASVAEPARDPSDWWSTGPRPEPRSAGQGDRTAPPRPSRPTPAAAPGPPVDVDFPPRRGTRRVLTVAVLLMALATAGAAWQVREDPDPESLTLLASLGVLTLFTWAVRAGSTQTTLSVRGGQLHVQTGSRRTTFDLGSSHTPIEVIGRPGRRGWKVVFGRGTMRPFTVDAGLVDPVEFMRVLRRYRPE